MDERVSVALLPLQWEAILRALMVAGRTGLHAEVTAELAAQNHADGGSVMRMTVDQAFKAAVEHPSQAAFDDLAEAIESSVPSSGGADG